MPGRICQPGARITSRRAGLQRSEQTHQWIYGWRARIASKPHTPFKPESQRAPSPFDAIPRRKGCCGRYGTPPRSLCTQPRAD